MRGNTNCASFEKYRVTEQIKSVLNVINPVSPVMCLCFVVFYSQDSLHYENPARTAGVGNHKWTQKWPQ